MRIANNGGRRRRSIEIYFVLYLASLILLLPEHNEQDPIKTTKDLQGLLSQAFRVEVEKPSMNCIFQQDSAGVRIFELDTSNIFSFTGNVADIEYEIVVSDPTSGASVRLSRENPVAGTAFALSNVPGQRNTIRFRWLSPQRFSESKSLYGKIIAHATPNFPQEKKENAEFVKLAGLRLRAENSFALNVVYSDAGFGNLPFVAGNSPPVSPNIADAADNPFLNPSFIGTGSGEFSGQILREEISAIAGDRWENKFFVSGISSPAELRRTPVVILDKTPETIGGSAAITDVQSTQILLSGSVPTAGKITVVVKAERKDGRSLSASFTVVPQSMPPPELPEIMYPGISYKIEPNMPQIPGSELRAALRDAKGEIVGSPQGASFVYTPSIGDTGKILIFERLVGGRRVGQPYTISVRDFPAPEILEMRPAQENIVLVRTRAYGLAKGRQNEVERIEFIDGATATAADLRGNIHYENGATIQTWRITTKSGDYFRIRIYDKRGKKSTVQRYN